MGDNFGNRRFEMAFSAKAIRHNTILGYVMMVPVIVLLMYVGVVTGKEGSYIAGAMAAFIILMLAIMQRYTNKLAKESYLEITEDSLLKCKCKWRKEVCYPVNQIKSIEKASLDHAAKKDATFPVVMNTNGREIYSSEGVLITFNRAWIKSVRPVYFNPVDIDGFISAIRHRIDSSYPVK